MKKKVSKLEVIMYVVAGIFAVIFVLMGISSVEYMQTYAEQYGLQMSEILWDAVKYFITQTFGYLAYGLSFFVFGKCIHKLNLLLNHNSDCEVK